MGLKETDPRFWDTSKNVWGCEKSTSAGKVVRIRRANGFIMHKQDSQVVVAR